MRHHYVKPDATSGDHWAVGAATVPGQAPKVLVQLGVEGEQVRLVLAPQQALAMAAELQRLAAASEWESGSHA